MTDLHQSARDIASRGIRIFPCRENSKKPAITDWEARATCDLAQIDTWWGEKPGYNIGMVPEHQGWCIIDVDQKDDGWRTAETLGLIEDTKIVDTPSGGCHVYYKGSLPGSVRKLGPGIDTRGRGSYVLVPPSVIDGKPYKYHFPEPTPIADLPAYIADQFREQKKQVDYTDEFDLPVNVAVAAAYLQDAKPAVQGEGGDAHTYYIACEVISHAITKETCYDLMEEHWNWKNDPPWSDEELRVKVDNAWTYMQDKPGANAFHNLDPAALEGWADYVEPDPPPAEGYPTIPTIAEIRHTKFPPITWLWKDRLMEGNPNLYTGAAGTGKTTLAEHIAVAVAAGVPLLDQPTKQAHVFMLVGEDPYGPVRDNLLEIGQHLGVPDDTYDRISILSTKSHKLRHLLAADTGSAIEERSFYTDLIRPHLNQIEGPILWIIDPMAEFMRFDRFKDDATRDFITGWMDDQCQDGRVTILATDHPSRAGVKAGEHYAGSREILASFPLMATLIGGEWTGDLVRKRQLTFSVEKGRYAGEHKTTFFRTSLNCCYYPDGPPGDTKADHKTRVLTALGVAIHCGQSPHYTDAGGAQKVYGPTRISEAARCTKEEAVEALRSLAQQGRIMVQDGVILLPNVSV